MSDETSEVEALRKELEHEKQRVRAGFVLRYVAAMLSGYACTGIQLGLGIDGVLRANGVRSRREVELATWPDREKAFFPGTLVHDGVARDFADEDGLFVAIRYFASVNVSVLRELALHEFEVTGKECGTQFPPEKADGLGRVGQ